MPSLQKLLLIFSCDTFYLVRETIYNTAKKNIISIAHHLAICPAQRGRRPFVRLSRVGRERGAFPVLLGIDVPVRFWGYCPLPPVGYCVHGALQICPVHRDLTRRATLDYRRRRKTERVKDGYIT
jgi:hypothetical protein